MAAASRKSKAKTSRATPSATSLPGSVDGPKLFASPAGPNLFDFGQGHAPASPSHRRGKGSAPTTPDTSGLTSCDLSPSAALQWCLESRLRRLLDVNGSLEFVLIWKHWDMPSGVPICALRGSVRRTSDKGCTGWPTPNATDRNVSSSPGTMTSTGRLPDGSKRQADLPFVAELTPWDTPDLHRTTSSNPMAKIRPSGTKQQFCLHDAADLSPWATPMSTDDRASSGPSGNLMLRKQADLSPWATPTCQDAANNAGPSQFSRNSLPLNCEATLTPRATPRAEDSQSAGMRHSRGVADTLSAQAGQDLTSSSAGTASIVESRPVLNPLFSLWLMGYRSAWMSCGVRAHRSLSKTPTRSRRK